MSAARDPSSQRADWSARAARAGRFCSAVAAMELAIRGLGALGAIGALAAGSAPAPSGAPDAFAALGDGLADVGAELLSLVRAVAVRGVVWSLASAAVYLSLAVWLLAIGGALRRAEPDAPARARRWGRVALGAVGAVVIVELALVVPSQLAALREAIAHAAPLFGALPRDVAEDVERSGRLLIVSGALLGGLLEAVWPIALIAWAGRLSADQPAAAGQWESPTRLSSGSRT
jgi:hypothetical protein